MKTENKKYLKVPENYFSELTSNVMDNISKLDNVETIPQKPTNSRKSKRSVYAAFAFISSIAAALVIILFLLPNEYSPFQTEEKNQDLLVSQGEYYLFLEDMQDDEVSDEYWMSMAE